MLNDAGVREKLKPLMEVETFGDEMADDGVAVADRLAALDDVWKLRAAPSTHAIAPALPTIRSTGIFT
jgi:hypothetical protein